MQKQDFEIKVPRTNYRPTAIDDTVRARKAAYEEIDKYFNSKIFTSYSQWAKEEVWYNNCEDSEIVGRLRSMNNSYALAMGADILSAYSKDGIDLDNMIDVWVSSWAIHANNKDFDADLTKSMLAAADNLNEHRERLPVVLRGFIGVAATDVRSRLQHKADIYQKKMIDEHLEKHDLDSLTMSARQIAAIKVNFMEQYYVDMREKCKTPADISKCERDYNTAVLHLEQIARNSGFDMGAIAAEERFIVGLKIDNNPRYAILFNETAGPYSAKPKIENGKWAGKFVTSDNHEYTVGGHPQQGAFTVRKPAYGSNGTSSIEKNVHRYAEQFAAIDSYLSTNKSGIPYAKRQIAARGIQKHINDCKNSITKMLMDDGVVKSDAQAEKWWTENFEKPRDKFRIKVEKSDYAKLTPDRKDAQNGIVTNMTTYGCMVSEMDRLINKEIILQQNLPYNAVTESALNSVMQHVYKSDVGKASVNCDEIENNCDSLSAVRNRINANSGDPNDCKNSEEALMMCRNKYMDTVSGRDIADMLMHAATNMEQGWEGKGTYQRTYAFSDQQSDKNTAMRSSFKDATASKSVQSAPEQSCQPHNNVMETNIDMGSVFGNEDDFMPPEEDGPNV